MSSNSVFKLIQGSVPLYYSWHEAMHTRLDIVLCDLPESYAAEVAADLSDEAIRLEKRLNRFDPKSDLAYLNKAAATKEVKLDGELWEIMSHCVDLGRRTENCFDITVNSDLPEACSLADVELNEANRSIRFLKPALKIDLGGYAKGLVLENIKKRLWIKGIENAMINFGNSSVYAVGRMPFAEYEGWAVAVDDVYRLNTVALKLALLNSSLSTSGNAGRSSLHIVSPETRLHVEGDSTVSVVSASPLESEVLSTALFAAQTAEKQRAILDNFEVDHVFAIRYPDTVAPPEVEQLV